MRFLTPKSQNAGFCFGVKRAIARAYEEAKRGNVYTLGPLIHNTRVIKALEHRRIYALHSLNEALLLPMQSTVLIRSHGTPISDYIRLKEKKLCVTDCTCPFVKKIHKIVKEQSAAGRFIIIAGDRNHPEVIGIKGQFEGECAVISSADECFSFNTDNKTAYALVSQTTFNKTEFDLIAARLLADIPGLINERIFCTICSATEQRQREACEISKKADVMLVFGDKSSSNSNKLFEICAANCKKTYFLESIEEILLKNISDSDIIGISVGASAPAQIIKEAVNFMNETDKTTQTFEEMLDESFVSLRPGDVVKGTVISVTPAEISVNLNYKSDGIIPKSEFTEDLSADLTALVNPGDEIEVYVSRVNDGEGNVLLSKKRLDSQKGWGIIEEAFNNGEPISGKFIDVIKGGMMATICGLRVFVPSSQVAGRYVEDLRRFKGKECNFKIIEFDRKARRIVAGRKELAIKEEKELKDKVFSQLEAGQKVTGTISRIVDFGAFVDLGGVDGLIHISQMSWGRIRKASDIVSEGQTVTVTVLDIDHENSKISLSLKDKDNDPWRGIAEKYNVGDIVDGRVVRMASFGAFVEIENGVDGLVHVSQISDKHIPRPDDALSVGDIISVKITEIDPDNKRISLSKKAVDYPYEEDDTQETDEITQSPAEEETPAAVLSEEAKVETAAETAAAAEEPDTQEEE